VRPADGRERCSDWLIRVNWLAGVTLDQAQAAQSLVTGTAPGQAVTLNLGTGTSAVAVGSATMQLQPIQSPLTVNGQSGTNQLLLQDQGTPPSMLTYVLAAGSVSRPGVTVDYWLMRGIRCLAS
jgi:hypothetical protein